MMSVPMHAEMTKDDFAAYVDSGLVSGLGWKINPGKHGILVTMTISPQVMETGCYAISQHLAKHYANGDTERVAFFKPLRQIRLALDGAAATQFMERFPKQPSLSLVQ